MTKFECQRVEKPWGYELIWAHTDRYVGKILHVEAGESLSLQYHEIKDETIHLLQGKLKFLVGENENNLKEIVLNPGDSFHVSPLTCHQMQAIETCDILEASTPELEDVVRLQDRYGRI